MICRMQNDPRALKRTKPRNDGGVSSRSRRLTQCDCFTSARATRAHERTRAYSTVYLLRVTLGRRKRKKSKALPTPKQSVGAISGAFRLKDARKQPQFNTHITHVDGTNRDTTL